MLNKTLNRIKVQQSDFHHLHSDESEYHISPCLEFTHTAVKKRFHDFVLPYDLNALRVVVLVAFIIYPLFCLVDYTINPSIFNATLLVRSLIFVFGVILILALTFLSPYRYNYNAMQGLTVAILSIGQAAHFVVGILEDVYELHLLMSSILLVVSGNTLMGLRFKNVLIINVVCLVMFEIIIIFFVDTSYEMAIFQNFVLLAVTGITLHTCYIRERNKHLLFIQHDRTNTRQEKLKKANHHLEVLLSDLDKKNKELERFSYIISHDLKAPLRVTNGLISVIGRKEFDVLSEQSKTDFDMIKDQSMQMGAMIDGVLEYSRIGRLNVEMEEVDVALILEKIRLARLC